MKPNSFVNCKKQQTADDPWAAKQAGNAQLPVDFDWHQLRNNGGKPAWTLRAFASG
jgi:hypothetical protein